MFLFTPFGDINKDEGKSIFLFSLALVQTDVSFTDQPSMGPKSIQAFEQIKQYGYICSSKIILVRFSSNWERHFIRSDLTQFDHGL